MTDLRFAAKRKKCQNTSHDNRTDGPAIIFSGTSKMILASSSRALLLAKGARCCRRSLPRLSHETMTRSLNMPLSSCLSTYTIDGNVFGSHYSLFSDTSTADATPIQKDILTPNLSSAEDSSRHYQFQQQIQQWISSNPKVAPYKAEESLARLWVEQQDFFRQWQEQHVQKSSPTIIFTTESVNLVLQAWCHSSNGEIAAERAERLLHWMEEFHSSESNNLSIFMPKPDYHSYLTVIDVWSRAAVYESDSNMRSGGGKISLATKAGFECAKRAEDVLMHMQNMHEQNIQSDSEYNSEVQPDTLVFNHVLSAWSKIRGGTKASAMRAMRILDLMQELHHHQYKNASEWQGILLSKVQPNLQTYKHVIYAWANATNAIDGPDRAELILRHMLSMSKAGNNVGAEIMPDLECFHIVMKAHAELVRKKRKVDTEERAQKVTIILDWLEVMSLRRPKIQPTTETYRIAMSAWVWSHHVDAPKEAARILDRMIRACNVNSKNVGAKKESYFGLVRPETRDFNTVINCCSFARMVGSDKSVDEDDESLLVRQLFHGEIYNIAEEALNALVSLPYVAPDCATFSGIIRACVNLLPNTVDRDERVIKLFRLAYRTSLTEANSPDKVMNTSSEKFCAQPGGGCVDANVLRQLRLCLPSTEDYRVREEFEEHRRQNCQLSQKV